MEALGTIVEILGSSMVLIKATGARTLFSRDEVLQVFAEVRTDTLEEKHGLRFLHIPKGELRVIAKQNEEYYLGQTFRPSVESSRVIEKPSSLLAGILSHEIVKENVPGSPSAILSNPTVPVEVSKRVEVGDKVGRA